ncbi:hypothetical protein HOY82DRAFT_538315 [Tuber indicum]|nr:hypothetical protein HOY82DRAFT_538315 [Tuber indicum]
MADNDIPVSEPNPFSGGDPDAYDQPSTGSYPSPLGLAPLSDLLGYSKANHNFYIRTLLTQTAALHGLKLTPVECEGLAYYNSRFHPYESYEDVLGISFGVLIAFLSRNHKPGVISTAMYGFTSADFQAVQENKAEKRADPTLRRVVAAANKKTESLIHGILAKGPGLQRTEEAFSKVLEKVLATRNLLEMDVKRNNGKVTIYHEDHVENQWAALVTFFKVQSGWADCLKWGEVPRSEDRTVEKSCTWCGRPRALMAVVVVYVWAAPIDLAIGKGTASVERKAPKDFTGLKYAVTIMAQRGLDFKYLSEHAAERLDDIMVELRESGSGLQVIRRLL